MRAGVVAAVAVSAAGFSITATAVAQPGWGPNSDGWSVEVVNHSSRSLVCLMSGFNPIAHCDSPLAPGATAHAKGKGNGTLPPPSAEFSYQVPDFDATGRQPGGLIRIRADGATVNATCMYDFGDGYQSPLKCSVTPRAANEVQQVVFLDA